MPSPRRTYYNSIVPTDDLEGFNHSISNDTTYLIWFNTYADYKLTISELEELYYLEMVESLPDSSIYIVEYLDG